MNFANTQIMYVLALFSVIVLIPYFIFCFAEFKAFLPWKMNLGTKEKNNTHEILYTLSTLVMIYLIFILSAYLQDMGILVFYKSLPTWYMILSIPLLVVIHDAYFYWTHYLMHKSKFFYRFHKQHHQTSDATPLDALAFHPIEAFVHFIFFVLYPIIIPTDLSLMQFMFVFMLICNSAGHLPYEFYPKFLYDFPIIRQFNAATHHQMHHKYYTTNFGLYYNWWDRWLKTNHQDYFVTFKHIKINTELSLEQRLHPTGKAFVR